MRIVIVTDSTCDLPEHLIAEAGIRVVPTVLHIGQESYRDGIDITREAFYERLPSLPEPPKTSAPAPGAFAALYEETLTNADQVVSIHLASTLSALHNTAVLAAKQISPDRIHVIDSGQVSMGLGWAVLAAAQAVRSGASLEGVIHSVADTLRRVRLFALLHSLEYLSRSGRINMVQAGLGTLLDLKPLFEVRDGVPSTRARIRTWSRALVELQNRTQTLAPLDRLAVMHTNYPDGAQHFLADLCASMQCPPQPLIVSATTVIGTHVGPHALAIAAVVSTR